MSEAEPPSLSPPPSPRVRGAREHVERVRLLLATGTKERDVTSRFRFMIMAVYSCRGVIELLLEAADMQESGWEERKALEPKLRAVIPFYDLIERIRIHDFHRFGVVAPDPRSQQTMYGGRVTLTVPGRGAAALSIGPGGPVYTLGNGATVKRRRALLWEDDRFFDEESRAWASLPDLLDGFLAHAEDAISRFEQGPQAEEQST